jgi:hypothetical protein
VNQATIDCSLCSGRRYCLFQALPTSVVACGIIIIIIIIIVGVPIHPNSNVNEKAEISQQKRPIFIFIFILFHHTGTGRNPKGVRAKEIRFSTKLLASGNREEWEGHDGRWTYNLRRLTD